MVRSVGDLGKEIAGDALGDGELERIWQRSLENRLLLHVGNQHQQNLSTLLDRGSSCRNQL